MGLSILHSESLCGDAEHEMLARDGVDRHEAEEASGHDGDHRGPILVDRQDVKTGEREDLLAGLDDQLVGLQHCCSHQAMSTHQKCALRLEEFETGCHAGRVVTEQPHPVLATRDEALSGDQAIGNILVDLEGLAPEFLAELGNHGSVIPARWNCDSNVRNLHERVFCFVHARLRKCERHYSGCFLPVHATSLLH